MAIILLQCIALSADGQVHGPIFVHRHSTRSIRRPYGHSKASPAQAHNQAAFTQVDLAWHNLSQANKQAWRLWHSWERTHGYNRFQRINIPRQLAGEPLIFNPADIP